ncbi:MAG TPA: histidine phosphatase family protein [Acidimicrobiales bacterium]|nr:histidine phosphatase family protein [Acidimicrobiales bacterium]
MEPLSLILFRHAKSDWHAEYGQDDRQRPLSPRGCRAARTMGRFLANAGQVPRVAMTSPAVRARRTLELAIGAGGWSCEVQVRPGLYGEAAELLAEIHAAPSDSRTLVLVGHEPAWSTGAQLLTGAGRIRLPTASMLRLELDADRWRDVGPATATITWLMVPRLAERARGRSRQGRYN